MKPSDLHVVTCISNPIGLESRRRLTRDFLTHMLDAGVDLTLVETQHANRPFEFADFAHIRHVPTRAETMAWSKESAINVGIRALPPTAARVGVFDADIEFRSRTWAMDTLWALDLMPVVQPWAEAVDLGPKGEIMTVKDRQVQRSFGWVYRETDHIVDWWKDKAAYAYPHCGYAWAFRMSFLDKVGLLLDRSGLGAADHQMALGMIGHADHAIHGLSSAPYKSYVQSWGERAFRACQGHLGYVGGRIEHSWHGEKAKRKYVERWDVLNRWQFDPMTDVHQNRWGILELSGNKPQMLREIEAYFRQRDEDANVRMEG